MTAPGDAPPPGDGLADTIVAPCTAPGPGERSVVRLSGADARALVGRVLDVPDGLPSPGRVGRAVLLLAEGAPLPVELLAFVAPRSSTGEDVVEVHLPGWPDVVTELVRRLVACGARPAARGEFARRALALGRLDLPGVLALGRLVAARTPDEAAAAGDELLGRATAEREALRAALLEALALVEAHVDFEEEDTEEVGEAELRAALLRVRALAARMGERGDRAASVDGETDVVLLGPPNAGKSLLFTALCPGARTTVSPLAGTTRDALEARVVRAGRRVRVLDGPGVDGDAPDPLERRAVERFVATLPRDAVVLCVEAVDLAPDPERAARLHRLAAGRPRVDVLNKVDLERGGGARDDAARAVRPDGVRGAPPGAAASPGPLRVSALERTGLDALWDAVLAAAPAPSAPDLARRDDRAAAAEVLPLLDATTAGPLDGALPLLSLALREAWERLEASADERLDLDEEVLDRIFSTFCVGK